jgi:bifunctional DNA-binding transcriptional regulator/antitoxin component of YhaV-PrlF toxin-antitoxin module
MIQALELKAKVDGYGKLVIDKPLLSALNREVKVIVLFEQDEDEYSESVWLQNLSANSAFNFLKEEQEDIYTPNDGKPFMFN